MLRFATATALAFAALALPSAAAAQDTDLFSTARGGHADIALDTQYGDDNFGYGEEAGEVLDCLGSGFGATAWYRFRAERSGPHTVTTLESDFDTVLSVYRAAPGGGIPAVGQREGCGDDFNDNERTSFVDFNAEAGRIYYAQVGGYAFDDGSIDQGEIVIAAYQPPANDARANAERIDAGGGVAGYNFNASTQSGERLSCGGAAYGSTSWYKVTAPAIGDATVTVTSTDMNAVVAVYRGGSGTPIGCNDNAPGSTTSASLSGRVSPGEYFIQVGGRNGEQGTFEVRVTFGEDKDLDDDGSVRGLDCNDNNAGIRPGAPEGVNNDVDENCDGVLEYDRDGDGSRVPGSPGDCDDGDPARSPLKAEVPGNDVDENCDKIVAPFPVIPSRFVAGWGFGKTTTMRELILSNAIRGSKITLRCRGKGCRFKSKTIRVRRKARQMKLHERLTKRQRKYGKKARLTIRMSAPNFSPKETTYKMRPGRVPTRQDFCITDRRRRC
jgi:hypothetical protein